MSFDPSSMQHLYLAGSIAAFCLFGVSLAFVSVWSRGGPK